MNKIAKLQLQARKVKNKKMHLLSVVVKKLTQIKEKNDKAKK